MHMPHLSIWVGAVAGLRLMVGVECVIAIWFFRCNLARVLNNRFTAANGDVLRATIALCALGTLTFSARSLIAVVLHGRSPLDGEPWWRITLLLGFFFLHCAFTMLLAGVKTVQYGPVQGRRTWLHMIEITVILMGSGALL